MMRRLVRFRHDRRGSVAVIMAPAVVPVTFLVGAGVDYAHRAGIRAKLQAATNAAVLAAIREAPTLKSDADVQARARAYFDASVPARTGVTVTRFAPSRSGTQVTVSATAQGDMTLGRLMHPGPLEVYRHVAGDVRRQDGRDRAGARQYRLDDRRSRAMLQPRQLTRRAGGSDPLKRPVDLRAALQHRDCCVAQNLTGGARCDCQRKRP